MIRNYRSLMAIFLLLGAAGITACSKMNDLHDKYLREGETIYVSRLDAVNVRAGQNRVLFRYVNKDPKVARLLVYWRSRQDSAMLDLPPGTGDTLSVVVGNLPEDNYNFELITMTKESRYPSVPYEVSGNVYGDRFQATLQDRAVSRKELVEENSRLTVKWVRAPQYAVLTEVSYTDLGGNAVVKKVPVTDTMSVIEGVASGDVQYRTLFLPEPNAIDTFATSFRPLEPIVVEGVALNKALFKRWNPTGIPYAGNTAAAWKIENAWDNSITVGFANNNAQFTLDMGQQARLTRLLINNRPESNLLFNHSHMRKFQVWGSATASVTADFAGWTLLGEFESLKPSGAPLGTILPEDLQYGHVDGEKFYFPAGAPAVRYLRIVSQETWGKQAGIQFMEMSLMGVK